MSSKYVVITPEIWRTAIDIREDTDDIYQIAYKTMSYIFQTFEYDKKQQMLGLTQIKHSI